MKCLLLQVVCQGLSETVSRSWVVSFRSCQSLEADTFVPNYNSGQNVIPVVMEVKMLSSAEEQELIKTHESWEAFMAE